MPHSNRWSEDFDPAGGGPIGLSVVVEDSAEIERRPEAVWPETKLILAGYTPDGAQIRIRYFEDARIGPGLPKLAHARGDPPHEYPLEERYRLEPFAGSTTVGPDDVLALWKREARCPSLRRSGGYTKFIWSRSTRTRDGRGLELLPPAQPTLRADLLYYRAFVARAHRKSSLAGLLAVRGREVLDDLFVSGEETRAAGSSTRSRTRG